MTEIKKKAAIIGAGTLGCGWAVSFARAGWSVNLFDQDESAVERGLLYLKERLRLLLKHGLIDRKDDILALVTPCWNLADAVGEATFVQENVPEILELKQSLFRQIDEVFPANSIIASSTSGLLPSVLFADVKDKTRYIVAHPLNPPFLNPAVEIVCSPWTANDTVERTCAIMKSIGQVPILVGEEGKLILTRLQAAILSEAFSLVREGTASVEDVDKAVRDGLGLRYAVMGPFEVMDLNAPGGVVDFVTRYGAMFEQIQNERANEAPGWSSELVNEVDEQRRSILPLNKIRDRQEWRDERLMEILAYKRTLI